MEGAGSLSNTRFLGPTRPNIQNGISNELSVFLQIHDCYQQKDRLTDRLMDGPRYSAHSKSCYRCIANAAMQLIILLNPLLLMIDDLAYKNVDIPQATMLKQTCLLTIADSRCRVFHNVHVRRQRLLIVVLHRLSTDRLN